MPEITILTEAELRQCVTLDRGAVDRVEAAFARLDEDGVVMPAVLSMDLPEVNGEVDVKMAFIPGLDNFAIKVSPGFFDNPVKGLPSLNGLMVVLSAETGMVNAVLLDNGYLTEVRTAAAGAVAARHLAAQKVTTAGIIGAGVQAALQARALLLEREVKELLVWSREPGRTQQFARQQATLLGIPVRAVNEREELLKQSGVVISTTPACETLIEAEWLHPGLHITAMGSDAPGKYELDPAIVLQADRFVVDRLQQSLERGELRTAVEAGLISADQAFDEIGQICSGRSPGRISEDQVTVCDLTGTGVQDTAIANYALSVARVKGIGTKIRT